MVKIFEIQQQLANLKNHQSRIVEYESFQEYLQNVNERSLPPKDMLEVYDKYVDFEKQIITFMFEHKLNKSWFEFTHFAQVIDSD